MTPETCVVIPFKDEAALTVATLVRLRQEQHDLCLLYDNGSTDETRALVESAAREDDRVLVIPADGIGIYEMWNAGASLALEYANPVNVAYLNNDLDWCPGMLSVLADHLRADDRRGAVYPDWFRRVAEGVGSFSTQATEGTSRRLGMCGWCFMVRGEVPVPPIDTRLQWWCGDDFIEHHIRQLGYTVARVNGLPVDHILEATASNGENDWTHQAKDADLAYFESTYLGLTL